MLTWGPVNPILRLDSPETDEGFHQSFLLERVPRRNWQGWEGGQGGAGGHTKGQDGAESHER